IFRFIGTMSYAENTKNWPCLIALTPHDTEAPEGHSPSIPTHRWRGYANTASRHRPDTPGESAPSAPGHAHAVGHTGHAWSLPLPFSCYSYQSPVIRAIASDTCPLVQLG